MSTDGDSVERDHPRSLVRAAFVISWYSLVWTLGASTAAIAIGATQSSQVLIALGCIGLGDALGSAALISHFRHGLHHEAFSARRESLAHHAVSISLFVSGIANGAVAVARLIAGDSSKGSWAGMAVAAASVAALLWLARRKVQIARPLRAAGLLADGHLSAIGAVQAGVAVLGIAASRWLDVHWADSVAALAVSAAAVAVGIATWKERPA